MDKIEKALRTLTAEERKLIKEVLSKLTSGNTAGLDIKKLKGREDIFRARKGTLRIIYRKIKEKIFILAVER
mgnify:FL=1